MRLCFLLLLVASTTTGQLAYTWNDCLVAVSNSTDGIEVKITCGRYPCVHEQNFPGTYLSSLNRNEIWVENLTATEVNVTDVLVRYALILPLQSNVGVLELQYNSDTEQWDSAFSLIGGIDFKPCHTHFIQKVLETLFSVCIYPVNAVRSNVKLHKIVLNTTVLQDSTVQVQRIEIPEGSDFTDVVYASLGARTHEHFFLFIRDGFIAYILPLQLRTGKEPALLNYFESCNNFTCTFVHYVPETNLLIHCHCCINQSCTPYGIYYDIPQGELDINYTPRPGVLPYPCPDKTTVLVNETSHRFSIQGEEYNLEGNGFQNGLCSGDSSAVWFAYQDDTGQVFATEISSDSGPRFHILSENGCLDPNCSPITNVSDLLVIQQETSGGVIAKGIKPKNNYSVQYEVNSSQLIFFALVNYPSTIQLVSSSPVPSSSPVQLLTSVQSVQSPTPSSTLNEATGSENAAVYVGVAVTIIITIVVTPGIIIIVVCIWRHQKPKRKKPISESSGCFKRRRCSTFQHPTDEGGSSDVVTSTSPAVNPTHLHPNAVLEQHKRRTNTEDRTNDLRQKSNLIAN